MTLAAALPRLVIADDHRLILDALGFLIAGVATVVGTAGDGEALLRVVDETAPEIVVTDLSMPGLNGLEATRRLRALPRPPQVIILTIHADPALARAAFAAGAAGYVVKSADSAELRRAIETVAGGGRFLSPALGADALVDPDADRRAVLTDREREILALVASGATAKAIADRLGIAERTVKFHKMNLKARLGVGTTAEAVAWLARQATAVPPVP